MQALSFATQSTNNPLHAPGHNANKTVATPATLQLHAEQQTCNYISYATMMKYSLLAPSTTAEHLQSQQPPPSQQTVAGQSRSNSGQRSCFQSINNGTPAKPTASTTPENSRQSTPVKLWSTPVKLSCCCSVPAVAISRPCGQHLWPRLHHHQLTLSPHSFNILSNTSKGILNCLAHIYDAVDQA